MTIKELRAERKLTQAAFAKVIGVSTQSVASYEAGRIKPSKKVLDKIQEEYGVDLSTAAAKEPAAEKKSTAKKPAATKKPAAEKKSTEKKPAAAKKDIELIIQSPLGGVITPEEIFAKVGAVDKVYVRVDENKAYWVKGKKTGSVDLW